MSWSEVYNDFNTTQVAPSTAQFSFDPLVSKSFPGVEYSGTETNAVYTEMREVSGDFWFVQNAQFNGTAWIPQNIALPVYADHFVSTGQKERLFCAAGTNPVVWTRLAYTDPFGALVLTPAAFTGTGEVALSLSPTWAANGVSIMTGILFNVTDNLSNAASKLIDLQVGSVSKFNVDKSGRVVDSLGARRAGSAVSVPTDGSAKATVTYDTAFSSGTTSVLAQIINDPTVTPRVLSVQVPASGLTSTGFDVWVLGGDVGETCSIDYLAFGN